ncbi:MAG TPA: hypothetical protein VF181_08270 [Balneolaceae bacterium]
MKKYLFILPILLTLGCESLFNSSLDNFEVKTLETVPNNEFTSDLLYKASPGENFHFSSLKEVKYLLLSLQTKGVSLEAAWYREGSPSCGMLAVVVPTTLVVQLTERNDADKLPEAFDYVEKNEPILICPTHVKKLIPK